MIRTLIVALSLLCTSPAFGQAFDGGGAVSRVWSSSASNPTGSAPADAIEPANVTETLTESDWIDGVTDNQATDYLVGSGVNARKFRFSCADSWVGNVDPILAKGSTNFAHGHAGAGHAVADPDFTWTRARAAPSSTCDGGPIVSTNYWKPQMLWQQSNGLVTSVRSKTLFYYQNGTQGTTQKATGLRRDFGFIGGPNPADYNDTARRAEYAAAGMLYPGSPDTPAGFVGIQCSTYNGTVQTVSLTSSRAKLRDGTPVTYMARHLKNEAGQDPWGGTCAGTNSQPAMIIIDLIAPDCWDRTNLRSPDGRSHTAYGANSGADPANDKCPDGWAFVPQLEGKEQYFTTGFAEYGNWYLSSDRMNPPGTPGDPTSKDPCRQIGAWFCPGSTAHFDWINGWKSNVLDEMQRECLGVTVRGTGPANGLGGECNNGTISRYRRFKGGTSPDTSLSGGCTVIAHCFSLDPGQVQRFHPLKVGTAATVTIHHTH